MAKLLTLYHPELDATCVQTEGAFYGKGGLRDKGWILAEDAPTAKKKKTTVKVETVAEEDKA